MCQTTFGGQKHLAGAERQTDRFKTMTEELWRRSEGDRVERSNQEPNELFWEISWGPTDVNGLQKAEGA